MTKGQKIAIAVVSVLVVLALVAVYFLVFAKRAVTPAKTGVALDGTQLTIMVNGDVVDAAGVKIGTDNEDGSTYTDLHGYIKSILEQAPITTLVTVTPGAIVQPKDNTTVTDSTKPGNTGFVYDIMPPTSVPGTFQNGQLTQNG